MVTTRGMAAAASASASASPGRMGRPAEAMSPLVASSAAEGYEREREARIRENMERMQKLRILDLANRFNQSATGFAGGGSGRGRRKAPVTPGSVGVVRIKPASPSPARRSLRLKSLDPVNYCEIRTKKDKDVEGGSSVLIEVGSKEEVYAEDAPVAKEDQDDAEAIQDEEADHQVNNPPDDGDEDDDSRSESVVTSCSQDCQVNLDDIGCATPSKPAGGPKKRKLIERSPDCVASRLRSRSNKS